MQGTESAALEFGAHFSQVVHVCQQVFFPQIKAGVKGIVGRGRDQGKAALEETLYDPGIKSFPAGKLQELLGFFRGVELLEDDLEIIIFPFAQEGPVLLMPPKSRFFVVGRYFHRPLS